MNYICTDCTSCEKPWRVSARLLAAKMVLEATALAGTGGIIVLSLHIFLHGHHFQSIASMLRGLSKSSCDEPDSLHKAHRGQVQEELWKIRARMYKNAINLFVHPVGFLVVAFMYDIVMDFCLPNILRLLCLCGVYLTHTAVLKGFLSLSRQNLTIFYIVS